MILMVADNNSGTAIADANIDDFTRFSIILFTAPEVSSTIFGISFKLKE